MSSIRRTSAALLAGVAVLALPATATADVPVGPPQLVACPRGTDDHYAYDGRLQPYRCHSAVRDPLGNVVILRQGRSDASGPSAFGMLHALLDHNVQDHVVERVISSAYPRTGPRGRLRYSAEFRSAGVGVLAVWVDTDPARSKEAPDAEPFGVVTAYCKIPRRADPENRCPAWVNETL